MTTLGDVTFIHSLHNGEHKAFEKIFNRYYKALCSYVYGFIKEASATDDIVQELFVTLWNKRRDFENLEKIVSFLFVSARNAAINFLRHEQIKQEKLKNYAAEREDWESEDYWLMEEFDRKLERWLQNLPPECRKIIELSIDGKKNAEIAALLQLSINTVKNQKVKGYKILRDLYRDEYLLILLYFTDVYHMPF